MEEQKMMVEGKRRKKEQREGERKNRT